MEINDYIGDDECALCLDSMYKTDVYITKCNHAFHLDCIKNQVNSCCVSRYDCPSCRTNLLDSISSNMLSSGFNKKGRHYRIFIS